MPRTAIQNLNNHLRRCCQAIPAEAVPTRCLLLAFIGCLASLPLSAAPPATETAGKFSRVVVGDQTIEYTTVVYRSIGDVRLQADVFLPAGCPSQPALLWIHGGALIFGDRSMLHPGLSSELLRYLRAGIAVVSIDYRLAPETKLPEIASDVQAAWRWMHEEGQRAFAFDPERMAIAGQSAGGYLTLLAGRLLSPKPTALVAFYGYGDISAQWLTEPSPFYRKQLPMVTEQTARAAVGPLAASAATTNRAAFYLWCRQQGRWPLEVTGFDPQSALDQLERYCPAKRVTDDYPPTMLLHGDQDTDVPYAQSQQMAQALVQQGIECHFMPQRGYGHGFDSALDNDAVVAHSFDAVIAFLKHHLQPIAPLKP